MSRDVPQKNWARSVQPFCRLFLDTNKHTDRQAKFIYRYKSGFRLKLYSKGTVSEISSDP